jgi:molybdate transport system regulatory protein
MQLSTRNQLHGTVTDVKLGTVMAEVIVDIGGRTVVAEVTRGGVERLELEQGDDVTVLFKATEAMLGKGSSAFESLTIRNQIPGKVTAVAMGSVMAEVTIAVGGDQVVAAVTRNSVDRLGLGEGDNVVVLVKATEVMLGKGA